VVTQTTKTISVSKAAATDEVGNKSKM